MRELFDRAARGVVDLLFPPRCLVCDGLAEPFCSDCRADVEPVPPHVGPPWEVTAIRSVGAHQGSLRRAVLRLKFERKTALVEPLAELLAGELAHSSGWRPDRIVPVPIHALRRWERGFNQSELLAIALARRSGVAWCPALRRVRAARPQVGLSRSQRAVNLAGAFAHNPKREIRGARVLLLDDVWSTGSTLGECARVLRRAGATEVFGLTVTHDV